MVVIFIRLFVSFYFLKPRLPTPASIYPLKKSRSQIWSFILLYCALHSMRNPVISKSNKCETKSIFIVNFILVLVSTRSAVNFFRSNVSVMQLYNWLHVVLKVLGQLPRNNYPQIIAPRKICPP